MAEKQTGNIELRNAQIVEVGQGKIVLELSGKPNQPFILPSSREAEQWAAARLYHFVDIGITIGSAR